VRGPFDARQPGSRSLIVLCGLDGSGKSTQAALLAERLRSEGVRARAVWNRWRPTVSAPFIAVAKRTLRGRERIASGDYPGFREAKRREMSSGWKRGLWQAMVWTEYAWQVQWRTLPRRLGGTVVICDRYVYDTMIDVAINFSTAPERLDTLMDARLLALFPKPALVVFIDIDPAVGAARKADGTPVAYLADRREYYRAMARFLGAPVVDGGRPAAEVAARIWELAASWRRSLGRGGSAGDRGNEA
jgi:thymidylate kinase